MGATTGSPAALYVARQPILDQEGRLFGYELLHRATPDATSCTVEHDLASASVITSAMLDLGLETLTGGRLAFLNVTGPMVVEQIDTLIPPDNVVLELLETIEVTPQLIEACRKLRGKGYVLALDDFVPGSEAETLLPFVSFVKVDMLATSMPEALELARRLGPLGVTMLAEKVETREVYEQSREAGYTLFQGYYFCEPVIHEGAAIPANQLAYLRLLAALARPDLGMLELEALVKQDVSLSLRVLRYVNATAMPTRAEVRTIRQALMLIGIEAIRKWASVWYLAGLSSSATPELTTVALVRARSCEILAERSRDQGASEMFLVGLFSLLDVMLSRTMTDALENLPLSASTVDALVGHENQGRLTLDTVIAYENGEWERAARAAARASISAAILPAAYTGALRWARDVVGGGITSRSA